ncbi:hypothetical protein BV20DRAFT_1034316 [Pilatotrama ljubarskyi]|nr:hypothetical protein BV20DRAFT_1034316 [Pilatotrama ljubarskyi]
MSGEPAKSEAVSAGKPLRQAGRFEHFYKTRTQLKVLSWVVVAGKYQNDASATLDKPTLFAALEEVVRNQPVLASRLEFTSAAPNAPPTWIRLPSVDLNRIVDFRDEDADQLKGVLEDLYAVPPQCPDDVPLWRLLVLRDGTVVFAYEHTVGDGQSGMAFHIALLNALRRFQEPVLNHSGLITDFSDEASLTPLLEDGVDVSVPFLSILREVLNLIIPESWRKSWTAWTGKPTPESIVFGMNVQIAHYSPEDAQYLVKLSREHNTTLVGTFHTLALIVLSRLISAEPDASKYKSIATSIPISLRRFSGAPPTAFCNHLSALREYHPLLAPQYSSSTISADHFPWAVAARLTETLKREAPRSGSSIGLLKLLGGKYEQYLRGMLGKKRAAGLELSNLGPFPVNSLEKFADDAPPSSRWNVREVLFAQADATLGAALLLNVAGSPTGGVGVTLTSNENAVDRAFAEKFFVDFGVGIQGLLASRDTK